MIFDKQLRNKRIKKKLSHTHIYIYTKTDHVITYNGQ